MTTRWIAAAALGAVLLCSCGPPAPAPKPKLRTITVHFRDGHSEQFEGQWAESENFGSAVCIVRNYHNAVCFPLDTVERWTEDEPHAR